MLCAFVVILHTFPFYAYSLLLSVLNELALFDFLSFFHLFHKLTPDGCDAVVSSFLTFFQNVVFINI